MLIVSLGFDIQALTRFEQLYEDQDDDTLGRCFTAHERQSAGKGIDQMSRLAVRFSAKEAVLKALGGLEDGIALSDIEIRSKDSGLPTVLLSGGALKRANELNISGWLISLSHTDSCVGAVAIALSSA